MITAAVVIGPGSITVSSKIGAAAGSGLLWVLVLAASFMMLYMGMAARIGVLNDRSLLTLTAEHYGRWLAVTVGVLAFLVTTSFQMSNYLACSTALETLSGWSQAGWMAAVGLGAWLFVFTARQLYRVLERVMTALVLIMVLAFVANLLLARPNPTEWATGLWPRPWGAELTGLVVAMTATTFSVIAALYQSTLVQQKGWKAEDHPVAVREARFGTVVLALVSIMIMITAGSVLRGREIANAQDLAAQLGPLLGPAAEWFFAAGFLAAAFSSTVINAMIGGGLLADSLGLKSSIDSWPCRLFTSLAMAVGLASGFYYLRTGNPIEGIVLAQKTTILAVPLCALALCLLANDRRVVGSHRNGPLANVWAGLALVILLAMSAYQLKVLLGK